jgi:ribosomal protein S18 acetylase RimI-like enzyme
MPETFDGEHLSIVDLDDTNLSACLGLSTAAGWNQTEADWLLQIDLGSGVGLRTSDGRLVATGATLPASEDTGWIAMVLVDEAWRRRGLGRAVMQILIERAEVPHLALDATEQGRGLYESLGFKKLEVITRYRLQRGGGEVSYAAATPPVPRPGDRIFKGITETLSRRPDVALLTSRNALGLVRPGRECLHIGPVLADQEVSAFDLVASALTRSEGDVLIDVPRRLGTFSRRLEHLGFISDRAFERMSRGGALFVDPGTFATAGPEYG